MQAMWVYLGIYIITDYYAYFCLNVYWRRNFMRYEQNTYTQLIVLKCKYKYHLFLIMIIKELQVN